MRYILIFTFVLAASLVMAQQSVLRTGQWFKVGVSKYGVYKISYNDFKKMGFDADKIDPRNIKITGNAGGMLPQPNAAERASDLVENAIFISGEDDGVFNKNDFILWYAQGPDLVNYDVKRKTFRYENNLYSERNFYFITVAEDHGKRIGTSPSLEGSHPVVSSFDDYLYHENDVTNLLSSGREWFGNRFDQPQQMFSFDLPGVIENSTTRLVSDVTSQSSKTATYTIAINGVTIGTQTVAGITPSNQPQYDIKGIHRRDTFSTIATSAAKQEVQYQYAKTGTGTGYLDFFLLHVQRRLALYGDQTIFRSRESLDHTNSTFNVEAVNGVTIWDISSEYEPSFQTYAADGGNAKFSVETSSSLREFIVFNNNVPAPQFIGPVANQNLHGVSTPNLVIVTHPTFLSEAQRLAAHRESVSGWTTLVTTTDAVYNEFSSGRQDVTAIRDLAKYLYDKNSGVLKVLLLFGKSSYDYKDRVINNTNFVPTYESRNSLDPLATYSSDDYYGFMDNGEGSWNESPAQNHTLEIGIGRLPVKNIDEAGDIVTKIIDYETGKKSLGSWRKNIVFLADDGSNSDNFTREHQSQANTLANTVEAAAGGFVARKYFLGTYTKIVKPSGESIPQATTDVINNFDRGALIVNYTGHGNEQVLADEQVFTSFDIDVLGNRRYPFLVTATCEFGRNDDPAQISGAEQVVLRSKGGAIGLVTTARPVYSYTNFELNKAFYEALFERENNRYLSMGEVFRRTKNNSISGVGNRNFSLLCDPSLTLALPQLFTSITSVKTMSGSDTLKALSRVIVKGNVEDESGAVLNSFNGIAEAILYDKQADFTTIGKNNPAFTFKQWSNILFKGQASVHQGLFEMDFIMPKNMAYEIAAGKLSVYAVDATSRLDAASATADFKIGGSEKNPPADNIPPSIVLYLGDTTFISGGKVSPNTTLLARLSDASGISISNYGIGNTLTAILDNDAKAYALSDYYLADPDDFTKGWILDFPVRDLSPGSHTLTIKAWDTYNNPAQATIQFFVTEGDDIQLEAFGNYPNPFQTETTVFFTHNRAGDDLEAMLSIYNLQGELLKDYTFSIPESEYRVDLLEIITENDFGKKLVGGLYLARIAVRSLTNGSKNERIAKFIVVN